MSEGNHFSNSNYHFTTTTYAYTQLHSKHFCPIKTVTVFLLTWNDLHLQHTIETKTLIILSIYVYHFLRCFVKYVHKYMNAYCIQFDFTVIFLFMAIFYMVQ